MVRGPFSEPKPPVTPASNIVQKKLSDFFILVRKISEKHKKSLSKAFARTPTPR